MGIAISVLAIVLLALAVPIGVVVGIVTIRPFTK